MARRQRLLLAALIAVGLGFIASAGLIGNSGTPDLSVTDNPAVEALIPNRGDEVLQQQSVGIDLSSQYQLVQLTISADARCLRPVDVTAHARHVEGLQWWIYTPAEGRPIRELAAESNCAEATFEKIAVPGVRETIRWSFTVN